jgi:Oxidoreductase-like protein, N-terminal
MGGTSQTFAYSCHICFQVRIEHSQRSSVSFPRVSHYVQCSSMLHSDAYLSLQRLPYMNMHVARLSHLWQCWCQSQLLAARSSHRVWVMTAPRRHESSRAQDAADHRDQQQQAKMAEIPVVKPEEPGPEDCCQVSHHTSHNRAGRACGRTPTQSTSQAPCCCTQRGCQECVWDVYWRDMKAYDETVALAEGKPPPVDPFEVPGRHWLNRSLCRMRVSSGRSH